MFNSTKYIHLALLASLLTIQACKQTKEVKPRISEQQAQAAFGYLYISGCNERAKGNLQEALKFFTECQKLRATEPALNYELATVHKMLGHSDMALTYARQAALSKEDNEWFQLLYVECLNDAQLFTQALKIREALVKKFPEKAEFREDLAIQYAMMGQFDKSYKIYNELEKTYGINEQLTINKVKLLKSQHKNKEAEAELKSLIATDTLQTRYYGYLADSYFENNEMDKAKLVYEKILSLDKNDVDVHLALHDYYLKTGNETEAFEHLKLALKNPELDIAIKSGIIESYFSQAEAKSESGLQQGIELASILLNTHPGSVEANAIYADFLRIQKKYKEAGFYYVKALSIKKMDVRIWDNLLFVDNELANYDSLEHHSNEAMELFPNQPVYYIYNGVANTQLHNYSKATAALKSGLGYVIDNKALLIQFYSALGDAYYYLRDYPNSDSYYERALKEDADNTYVLNNYAYYLSQRNEQLEKAERLSKKSNELSPNNKNYMDTYGWILFQQKKYQIADEWLSKAAKMGGKNPTILEHYGDNLFMLGNVNEALLMWNEAVKAGSTSDLLKKKIAGKTLDAQ